MQNWTVPNDNDYALRHEGRTNSSVSTSSDLVTAAKLSGRDGVVASAIPRRCGCSAHADASEVDASNSLQLLVEAPLPTQDRAVLNSLPRRPACAILGRPVPSVQCTI